MSLCFGYTGFGNAMANESPFRQVQSMVWYRYHNYMANFLMKNHSNWSDEVVFQNARKWVIAVYQVRHLYNFYLLWG